MKRLFIAILGLSFIFLFLWMMVDIKEDIVENATNIKKKVVIKNIDFYGFQDKRLAFTAKALSAWSGDDVDEAFLSDVVSGQVYDKHGNTILDSLRAKKLYSNSRQESVVAEGGISAFFISGANASEEKASGDEKAVIEAEHLSYNSKQKKTFLKDNVKITQDKTEVTANRAEIENEKNIVHLFDSVTVRNKDYVLTTDKLVSYLDDNLSKASGNIRLVWLAQPSENIKDPRNREISGKETVITAKELEYSTKADMEYALLSGDVLIAQDNKSMRGQEGIYKGNEKKFYLYDDVKIELTSLAWLLKDETKERLSEEELESALRNKTTITADEAVFNKDTHDINMLGNVYIDQPKNEAWASEVVYDDNGEELILKKNVKIRKKNGEWIAAQRAIMYLANEVFEAEGQVATELTIKKK